MCIQRVFRHTKLVADWASVTSRDCMVRLHMILNIAPFTRNIMTLHTFELSTHVFIV